MPEQLGRRDLRVAWFESWHRDLDDALAVLPEMPTCPHDLFRELAFHPGPSRKRVALVTSREGPVAVIGLRRRKRHWEPVGQGVTPRSYGVSLPGALLPALAALGIDIRVEYWEDEPPPDAWQVAPLPVSRIASDADFEAYWRKSGHWAVVKPARRRTRSYTFAVDPPGGIDWIVRRWEETWRHHPAQEVLVAPDLLLAGRYYQARDMYHAFLLLDGDRPVAGNAFFGDHGDLILQTTARADGYERQGIGTRCLDLTFQWAADHGPWRIDLGGGHEYKTGWAPPGGVIWGFSLAPQRIRIAKGFMYAARGLLSSRGPSRKGAHAEAGGRA